MSSSFSIKTSDDQLIQGCKAKNRLAQRYLYEKYFSVLMRKLLRYTQNDREQALDILNRAFLKVFSSLEQFRGDNFEAWVSKIAIHTAIDSLRVKTTYSEHISFEEVKNEPLTDNFGIDTLNMTDLWNSINKLSVATRTVFVLHAIDGYKQNEIAELLKISEGTVKWHFSEAKTQLRKIISKTV